MRIAVTGATGFIGHYIVRRLAADGHVLRCWYRPTSDRTGFEAVGSSLEWVEGGLNDAAASRALVAGCDAVVHAALYRQGSGFRGAEGELIHFVEQNVIGTLRLIEAARDAGVSRFRLHLDMCRSREDSGRPTAR